MSRLGRLFGGFRKEKRASTDDTGDSRATIGWVVAGLGNPGEKYARSRHNAGFMAIDRFAESRKIELNRRRFSGLTGEATVGGERAILVKPETFYNVSGECIGAILGYFKVPPSRLIVLHDDLDLERGRLRIKKGGGDAGNRGVRSIAEALASPDFIRIRIGIGRPADAEDSKDYVLKPMRGAEMDEMDGTLARAAEAIEAVAADGLERAMGRFNQRA